MTVEQVYSHFHTPKNLQHHMIRVAALTQLVIDHWMGQPIDRQSVLATALFHDLAKPITFDMNNQKQFVKSEAELRQLQIDHDDLIQRFGTNEHEALVKMFKEIGLSEKAQKLVNNLEWSYSDRLIEENDFESLIPIYCDMRISPKGIVAIADRILELDSRVPVEDLDLRLASAERLEKIIQDNTSFDLNSIDDKQINQDSAKLTHFEFPSVRE